jgi:hypothetical protein
MHDKQRENHRLYLTAAQPDLESPFIPDPEQPEMKLLT